MLLETKKGKTAGSYLVRNRRKGNQAVQAEAQHTRENTQPRQGQLANRFGVTFGHVFPLKRSSNWALNGLFWMGQGKLGKGTRQYEKATPYSSPCQNEQRTINSRWGWISARIRTYDIPCTYE